MGVAPAPAASESPEFKHGSEDKELHVLISPRKKRNKKKIVQRNAKKIYVWRTTKEDKKDLVV